MEKITLGQIANAITFVVALAGSISALLVGIKKIFNKQLEPLNETIKQLDINQCKNYLVRFLADVESGEKLDNAEIERAYEAYDHYTKDLNANSYIHDKWERLMKKEVIRNE